MPPETAASKAKPSARTDPAAISEAFHCLLKQASCQAFFDLFRKNSASAVSACAAVILPVAGDPAADTRFGQEPAGPALSFISESPSGYRSLFHVHGAGSIKPRHPANLLVIDQAAARHRATGRNYRAILQRSAARARSWLQGRSVAVTYSNRYVIDCSQGSPAGPR